MAGTILINFIIGTVAFVITFLTALSGNVLIVSLERAFYAFLVFFILSYIIRWIIGRFIHSSEGVEPGYHIDLFTPSETKADEEAAAASDHEPSDMFTPFVPPRIERPEATNDPNKIANIIRRLADE